MIPEWIRKIYVICSGADSVETCRKCPFFRLPEDRFFCASDLEVLQEKIESEIKFRDQNDA